VEKSASFRNVPLPKSRLYESARPSTRSNSGSHPSTLFALSTDAKKCCTIKKMKQQCYSSSFCQWKSYTHSFSFVNFMSAKGRPNYVSTFKYHEFNFLFSNTIRLYNDVILLINYTSYRHFFLILSDFVLLFHLVTEWK